MAAEIQRLFEGTWTHYDSDDFDKYLDKMGVGMLKKKMATSLTPTITVNVEGETIKLSTSAGPTTKKNSFTLGSPFDIDAEVSGTGVASFDGGVLTIQVTPKDPKKGKAQTVTRQIIEGNLVQTMVVEEVKCKRYFKRT